MGAQATDVQAVKAPELAQLRDHKEQMLQLSRADEEKRLWAANQEAAWALTQLGMFEKSGMLPKGRYNVQYYHTQSVLEP